ncbi:hypothetical protein BT69DRAFT_1333662 [Atractiella rhizophila]|nr:hypothetical protein BT69DRAFT_1333662 [Atractiella rhizophila]
MPTSRVLTFRDTSPVDELEFDLPHPSSTRPLPPNPIPLSIFPPEIITSIGAQCDFPSLLEFSCASKRIRALLFVLLFRSVDITKTYKKESDKALDWLWKFRTFGLSRVGGVIRHLSIRIREPSRDQGFAYDKEGLRTWAQQNYYNTRHRFVIYRWKEDEPVDEDLEKPPCDWGLKEGEVLSEKTVRELERQAGLLDLRPEEPTPPPKSPSPPPMPPRSPSPEPKKIPTKRAPKRKANTTRGRRSKRTKRNKSSPPPVEGKEDEEQTEVQEAFVEQTGHKEEAVEKNDEEDEKEVKGEWTPLPRAPYALKLPYTVAPLPPRERHNDLTRSIAQRLAPQLSSLTIRLPKWEDSLLNSLPKEADPEQERWWEAIGKATGLEWLFEHQNEGCWDKLRHLEIMMDDQSSRALAVVYWLLKKIGVNLRSLILTGVYRLPPKHIPLLDLISSLPIVHLSIKIGVHVVHPFFSIFTQPPTPPSANSLALSAPVQAFHKLKSLHITFSPGESTRIGLPLLFPFLSSLPDQLEELALSRFAPINFDPFDANRIIEFPSLRILRLWLLPSEETARSFALFRAFEGARKLGLIELRGDLKDVSGSNTRDDKLFQGGYVSSLSTLVHWLHQDLWPELVQINIGHPNYKTDKFSRPKHPDNKDDWHFNPRNDGAVRALMAFRGGRTVKWKAQIGPWPKRKRRDVDSDY